ncbi:tyrosine-protein phosphatase 99A-like isoform X2 [Gigantopelta aegis]|uniref:tyrosine-protein phosphatase 99A-like isoform X2 n=1 Tax=Gigantopelta aegis TaxID=1735272 RepID=UPI001B887813|nr:tyrosine-protein phosphatase 99A-like isoform X2 [Gigantopelta aegis]
MILPLLIGLFQLGLTVGAATPVDKNVVERTVSDNVSLACVTVRGDEKIGGILWYRNTTFFASKGQNKNIKYADDSYASKVNIVSDNSLIFYNVEVADSANYTCKVFVEDPQSGSMNSRNLTWVLRVQDVPSAPGKPVPFNIKARQVTVKWDASMLDNNSPISVYIVSMSLCSVAGGGEKREVVVGSATREITIRELQPHSCYRVQVTAKNDIGKSPVSETSDKFYTLTEAPTGHPRNIKAVSNKSTEILLEWNHVALNEMNGELKGYELSYEIVGKQPSRVRLEDPSKTSIVLSGLKPFTRYRLHIKAYNQLGSGPPANITIRTAEGVPSKPRITHITNRISTSFYVHWEPPKHMNGRLKKYELQWSHNDSLDTRLISGHLNNPMSALISDLKPYSEYRIRVAAYTNGGRGLFSDSFPGLTDVKEPSSPTITNLTILSEDSIYVSWDPPDVFYKQIDNYLVKWGDTRTNSYNHDKLLDGTATETMITKMATNKKYRLKVAGITYGIFSSRHYLGDFTESIEFSIGDPSTGRVAEEQVMSAGVIAGVISAVIIAIIVILIVVGYRSYTCRKCYQAAYYYLAVPSNSQSSPSQVITVAEPPDEKEYPEIPVNNFINHVNGLHADGDIGFATEFEDVNTHTCLTMGCESSSLPENRNRNRYINIAAFDHSRVILKTELGRLRQSDYINANYIDGYLKHKAYIATQGPLPQSFADFWRMIWEQNSTVIVMITNLMERGRRKCDQYWPTDGLEIYGSMSVKLLNTVQRAHYTVRIFSVRNMKVKKKHSVKGVGERLVFQYHYTEWPDHGVPDYTLPCLTFVRKSAADSPEGSGPIVVHCSAGVGRTGTYILIDSMIEKIKDLGTINIPGFLLHIRKQRNFLVQTEDQYMFIHDVLVEYILGGGETEVTCDKLTDYIETLTQAAVDSGGTRPEAMLEKQYKLVTSHVPSEDELAQAEKSVNESKNRNTEILPVSSKRVILPAKPGIEGSDYINATYLQGFNKSNEFIVTQHPLESTTEDFWRMVWDRNSPVIIVLSYVNNDDYKEFWPKKDESIEFDAGNFKLVFQDEEQQSTWTQHKFLLESTQYDFTFETKLVAIDGWPGACSPLYTVFNLIKTAQQWLHGTDMGPVIIVDRFGGVLAGKLCALWTLYDQLTQDKSVDVYQLTKLYHLKRPGIIGTQDDYLFLYKAVESLHKHNQEDKESVSSSPKHHGSIRKNGTLPHNFTNSKVETNI